MTDEELDRTKLFFEDPWFLERPAVVQDVLRRFPPTQLYCMKLTSAQCVIHCVNEPIRDDVPVTVDILLTGVAKDKHRLAAHFANTVIEEVLLDDLEPWTDD